LRSRSCSVSPRRSQFLLLAKRKKRSRLFGNQFSEVEDACALAQAMVDTVREPLIVLDKELRVVGASRSFYEKFSADPDDTQGKHSYELGDGEWDIPKRTLSGPEGTTVSVAHATFAGRDAQNTPVTAQ
jgi:hypothetical protein